MTIGGPGGIGGPKGPGGLDGPGDVDDVDGLDDVADAGGASAVAPGQLDALAADLAAGKLSPQEAIDRLVEDAGVDLDPTERAELREMIVDLVANDPYLSSLANRV